MRLCKTDIAIFSSLLIALVTFLYISTTLSSQNIETDTNLILENQRIIIDLTNITQEILDRQNITINEHSAIINQTNELQKQVNHLQDLELREANHTNS